MARIKKLPGPSDHAYIDKGSPNWMSTWFAGMRISTQDSNMMHNVEIDARALSKQMWIRGIHANTTSMLEPMYDIWHLRRLGWLTCLGSSDHAHTGSQYAVFQYQTVMVHLSYDLLTWQAWLYRPLLESACWKEKSCLQWRCRPNV